MKGSSIYTPSNSIMHSAVFLVMFLLLALHHCNGNGICMTTCNFCQKHQPILKFQFDYNLCKQDCSSGRTSPSPSIVLKCKTATSTRGLGDEHKKKKKFEDADELNCMWVCNLCLEKQKSLKFDFNFAQCQKDCANPNNLLPNDDTVKACSIVRAQS